MSNIEAGWYQDPVDAERLRYWNGERWTPETKVKEVVVAPPVTRPAEIQETQPVLHSEPDSFQEESTGKRKSGKAVKEKKAKKVKDPKEVKPNLLDSMNIPKDKQKFVFIGIFVVIALIFAVVVVPIMSSANKDTPVKVPTKGAAAPSQSPDEFINELYATEVGADESRAGFQVKVLQFFSTPTLADTYAGELVPIDKPGVKSTYFVNSKKVLNQTAQSAQVTVSASIFQVKTGETTTQVNAPDRIFTLKNVDGVWKISEYTTVADETGTDDPTDPATPNAPVIATPGASYKIGQKVTIDTIIQDTRALFTVSLDEARPLNQSEIDSLKASGFDATAITENDFYKFTLSATAKGQFSYQGKPLVVSIDSFFQGLTKNKEVVGTKLVLVGSPWCKPGVFVENKNEPGSKLNTCFVLQSKKGGPPAGLEFTDNKKYAKDALYFWLDAPATPSS